MAKTVCEQSVSADAARSDCLAPSLGVGTDRASAKSIMPLLTLIFVIVLVGVLLWAVNSFIPMDSKVRSILNAVVVIVLVLWLLQAFGVFNSLAGVRVGYSPAARLVE
jgi:hypothetical protein